MCGRYALAGDFAEFTKEFALEEVPGLLPRFNIAPSYTSGHEAPILTAQGLVYARFWYIPPFYTGSLSDLPTSFNARAETVLSKSFFRGAQPCLVPTTGFREFPGPKGHKRAVCFYLPAPTVSHVPSGTPPPFAFFAFAGIHSKWQDRETGELADTFAILTTEPSPVVSPYHDRMPLCVFPEKYASWVAGEQSLGDLVVAATSTAVDFPLRCYPASTFGNSTRAEGIACIAPVSEQLSLF